MASITGCSIAVKFMEYCLYPSYTLPAFMILDAIRTYGSEVVRRAMAVTARDVTRLVGIH